MVFLYVFLLPSPGTLAMDSSKEYLMEEDVVVLNEADAEKESIQLFTLANFDQTYAYRKDSPRQAVLSHLKHVEVRATLPDLMTDTFAFDHQLSVGEYEIESNQHHNLYIIHKPAQAMDNSGTLCHDLLSFQSSVAPDHSTDAPHFGTACQ